jgi:N-acetylglucosamine-6-phosphate deacetylase
MPQLTGILVTPHGLLPGTLTFGRLIEGLEPHPAQGPYLLPGFIDTHVHGGGGFDTMDGAEGVAGLARFHAQRGTTTLCPTTITNPWQRVVAALAGVREVMAAAEPGLPDIPGAHLEGPFLNPDRLGAQPPYALEPTSERIDELLATRAIKLVTLAPEVKGAPEAAERFARAGVRVSVGHTLTTYAQVAEVAERVRAVSGTLGFTHLYNAMSPLTSREPGAVGAALADRETFAELILDLHHVHAGSFLAAMRAKPERLHLVTDAIRACGLGEGESELGGQRVVVQGGAARLVDGTLAGSVLTLDKALRHALELGVSLPQASRMLSSTPARYLGLDDRGALEVGLRADLVVLSESLKVLEVFVAGRSVTG